MLVINTKIASKIGNYLHQTELCKAGKENNSYTLHESKFKLSFKETIRRLSERMIFELHCDYQRLDFSESPKQFSVTKEPHFQAVRSSFCKTGRNFAECLKETED